VTADTPEARTDEGLETVAVTANARGASPSIADVRGDTQESHRLVLSDPAPIAVHNLPRSLRVSRTKNHPDAQDDTPPDSYSAFEPTPQDDGAPGPDLDLEAFDPSEGFEPESDSASKLALSPPRTESANDQPAAIDTIGFKPYVDAMALFLTSERTEPPLTISIEGEWGSGKSSFVAQLKEAIKARYQKESDFAFVDFNAWQHDKHEALWASFALTFSSQLIPKSWITRARVEGELFLHRLNKRIVLSWLSILVPLSLLIAWLVFRQVFLAELNDTERLPTESDKWLLYLKVAVPAALGTPLVAALIPVLWNVARMPLRKLAALVEKPEYGKKLSFLEKFRDDFARCFSAYGRGRQVFVFVDDLDRCEIPKAAELLHAINLLLAGGLPLIVVLAMDRRKIAAGVAARHKDLLPFLKNKSEKLAGIEHGYEFVEKFVQVPFHVPRIGVNVNRYIDALVGVIAPTASLAKTNRDEQQQQQSPPDVVTTDGPEVRKLLELVAPVFNGNPRRMKQFLNLFRLRYYVAWKTGQVKRDARMRWTVLQLGKVVAMELRWPDHFPLLLESAMHFRDLCKWANFGTEIKNTALKEWCDEPDFKKLLKTDSGDLSLAGFWLPGLYGALEHQDEHQGREREGAADS
jgi:hypothetical protein